MKNRLFCTFTKKDKLEETLETIQRFYQLKQKQIFVLEHKGSDEYICTYSVQEGNVNKFIGNTILVHRKKDTNTLYTINALNEVIKNDNNGVLDTSFPIDWKRYKNCILLTREGILHRLDTKLHDVVVLQG